LKKKWDVIPIPAPHEHRDVSFYLSSKVVIALVKSLVTRPSRANPTITLDVCIGMEHSIPLVGEIHSVSIQTPRFFLQ
jgi:hypothetical protein